MGIWDYISSTTDTVKNSTPSLASVHQVYRASYDYGWHAVSGVGKAVKSVPFPLQKLSECVQDQETQSKVKGFATVLGKNAAELALYESSKLIPGGYLVSKSYSDYYKSGKDKKIKDLEAEIHRLKMERCIEQKSTDKRTEVSELLKDKALQSEHQNFVTMNPHVYESPVDVLRVFMMKHFIGSHLLDDLIVPGTGTRIAKKQKLRVSME